MQSNLILLLETATSSCSVALAENGNVLACKELNEQNVHASHITLFIEEVMNSAGKRYSDLNAIAVSKGPGSYTGLRIGVSTAKGLCFALDIPLISVNTLEAMADGARAIINSGNSELLFSPMIDARRMEVYTALYSSDLKEINPVKALILEENSFSEFLDNKQIVFFGNGAEKCKPLYSSYEHAIFLDYENSASDLNQLALQKYKSQIFEDVAYFEPFYLKDFVATRPAEKRNL
ncbi:tRNA (adenosine(37)-N6)-threonylcarbamoyltransferase complex dimerization subunit type 1 TsaB [Daejeonella oryzae]|uniref:tRNA (adenosine(37)-N6)-threonylcarbamoyltransferase complex dimerization subunit type 1 TsaB n=1 Tax=Daejeonella oryzae TaxID=1122943 RepID=UPI00040205A4|nr:tRNA (adenosine(37)-N6)-threonylcarbamoyltransferase complex dimerization subunit type 1 TsaB [Daejeonella oryzae]